VEEVLHDSAVMWQFVGIDLGHEPVPDETTACKFRHLLEEHQLGDQILGTVNLHLQAQGVRITTGMIVDATILLAPSSTRCTKGQSHVIKECALGAQDHTYRRYRYRNGIDEQERAKNRTKSSVRSKVEHVFQVMNLQFGFVKLRYRGLRRTRTGCLSLARWSICFSVGGNCC
jgi:IS5 family transposase